MSQSLNPLTHSQLTLDDQVAKIRQRQGRTGLSHDLSPHSKGYTEVFRSWKFWGWSLCWNDLTFPFRGHREPWAISYLRICDVQAMGICGIMQKTVPFKAKTRIFRKPKLIRTLVFDCLYPVTLLAAAWGCSTDLVERSSWQLSLPALWLYVLHSLVSYLVFGQVKEINLRKGSRSGRGLGHWLESLAEKNFQVFLTNRAQT